MSGGEYDGGILSRAGQVVRAGASASGFKQRNAPVTASGKFPVTTRPEQLRHVIGGERVTFNDGASEKGRPRPLKRRHARIWLLHTENTLYHTGRMSFVVAAPGRCTLRVTLGLGWWSPTLTITIDSSPPHPAEWGARAPRKNADIC